MGGGFGRLWEVRRRRGGLVRGGKGRRDVRAALMRTMAGSREPDLGTCDGIPRGGQSGFRARLQKPSLEYPDPVKWQGTMGTQAIMLPLDGPSTGGHTMFCSVIYQYCHFPGLFDAISVQEHSWSLLLLLQFRLSEIFFQCPVSSYLASCPPPSVDKDNLCYADFARKSWAISATNGGALVCILVLPARKVAWGSLQAS